MPEIQIADDLTVTIRRATVRDGVMYRALRDRLDARMDTYGEAVAAQWPVFALCASQTEATSGSWQPPSLFASDDELLASFEAWLALLPTHDALGAWVGAIGDLNRDLVAAELSPDGPGDEVDADDPK